MLSCITCKNNSALPWEKLYLKLSILKQFFVILTFSWKGMIIDVQCLNIPAGVPTHRYDDTSCVLVDTYFRSCDKSGEWHPEPLPGQPVKWRPSYLYYVNRMSDT